MSQGQHFGLRINNLLYIKGNFFFLKLRCIVTSYNYSQPDSTIEIVAIVSACDELTLKAIC